MGIVISFQILFIIVSAEPIHILTEFHSEILLNNINFDYSIFYMAYII